MMHRAIAFGALVGVVGALCIALWPAREMPQKKRSLPPVAVAVSKERAEPAVPRPSPVSLTPASLAVTPPRAAALPAEAALMSTLRALGDSEPERSLQLARETEQRFPGSPEAAEREWYVCKSLVNLERFYDAREEARVMVLEYPNTPWAEDVARHLLVNPLDLPGDPAP